MNIIIDNQIARFETSDFPILISGKAKTGTSYFSLCLLASLANGGRKALLFSAYPQAKEEFARLRNEGTDVIIIETGDESALIDALNNTADIRERSLLIKNFELYSEKVFEAVKDLPCVIFSGDIDNCPFAERFQEIPFKTKIFFSAPDKYPQADLGTFSQYVGKIFSPKYNGNISLMI